MMKRVLIHFAVILAFALAQLSVVTHEIGHLGQYSHTKHDKNAPIEQCEQCLSHAQLGAGLASTSFVFQPLKIIETLLIAVNSTFYSYYHPAYTARAPPQIAIS